MSYSSSSLSSKNNVFHQCNNCNKIGHSYYQCKYPTTSFGIILYRNIPNTNNKQFLIVRRRNTFGFIDFIRGKYIINDYDHLVKMFYEMCMFEKRILLHYSFETLWKIMWDPHINMNIFNGEELPHFEFTKIDENNYKSEELSSKKKFENIKQGIQMMVNNKNTFVDLEYLINNSKSNWLETEWEFPKGRKNMNEKDIDCALREFEEETGIPKTSIQVINNITPFEEIFMGSNHKTYRYKYFLAYSDDNLSMFEKETIGEVSKVEWKTFDECIKSIRDYHYEKINIITHINKTLQSLVLHKSSATE